MKEGYKQRLVKLHYDKVIIKCPLKHTFRK